MNKQEDLYQGFYKAIKESYCKYLLYGDRSKEKLKPLHKWVGETINKKLPPNLYKVYYLNGKEVETEGRYYNKTVDIAIVDSKVDPPVRKVGFKNVYYAQKIEMAISIKFITSNFKQNANNYFENLLGECKNIRANNIKFGYFVVFRDKIPYFDIDKGIKCFEVLDDNDVEKYIKLFEDIKKSLDLPNIIGMEIINIDPIVEEDLKKKPKFSEEDIKKATEEKGIKIENGINNTNLSEEKKKFILDNFNLQQFFTNIEKILGAQEKNSFS